MLWLNPSMDFTDVVRYESGILVRQMSFGITGEKKLAVIMTGPAVRVKLEYDVS